MSSSSSTSSGKCSSTKMEKLFRESISGQEIPLDLSGSTVNGHRNPSSVDDDTFEVLSEISFRTDITDDEQKFGGSEQKEDKTEVTAKDVEEKFLMAKMAFLQAEIGRKAKELDEQNRQIALAKCEAVAWKKVKQEQELQAMQARAELGHLQGAIHAKAEKANRQLHMTKIKCDWEEQRLKGLAQQCEETTKHLAGLKLECAVAEAQNAKKQNCIGLGIKQSASSTIQQLKHLHAEGKKVTQELQSQLQGSLYGTSSSSFRLW